MGISDFYFQGKDQKKTCYFSLLQKKYYLKYLTSTTYTLLLRIFIRAKITRDLAVLSLMLSVSGPLNHFEKRMNYFLPFPYISSSDDCPSLQCSTPNLKFTDPCKEKYDSSEKEYSHLISGQ